MKPDNYFKISRQNMYDLRSDENETVYLIHICGHFRETILSEFLEAVPSFFLLLVKVP